MTSEPRSSIQFDLKEIFALTAFVAVLLYVTPIAYGSGRAATDLYLWLGLMQVVCMATAYERFRMTAFQRCHWKEQPYEMALIGSLLTLGTWILTVMGMVEGWWRIDVFPSFGWVLVPALICVLPHFAIFFMSIFGLAVMRERSRHRALAALFLLCLANTVLMFGAMSEFVGSRIPSA